MSGICLLATIKWTLWQLEYVCLAQTRTQKYVEIWKWLYIIISWFSSGLWIQDKRPSVYTQWNVAISLVILIEEVSRKDKYFLFSLSLSQFLAVYSYFRLAAKYSGSLATSIIYKAVFVHNPANFTPSNLLHRLLTVARFQQILGIHFHFLYLWYLPVISPSAFCQSMTLKSSLP